MVKTWTPYDDARSQYLVRTLALGFHQSYGPGEPTAEDLMDAEHALTALLDVLDTEDPELAEALRWGGWPGEVVA